MAFGRERFVTLAWRLTGVCILEDGNLHGAGGVGGDLCICICICIRICGCDCMAGAWSADGFISQTYLPHPPPILAYGLCVCSFESRSPFPIYQCKYPRAGVLASPRRNGRAAERSRQDGMIAGPSPLHYVIQFPTLRLCRAELRYLRTPDSPEISSTVS